MADKSWLRVRFVIDAMVATHESKDGLTWEDMAKAGLNAGTAVRIEAFEGVKDVEISFTEEDKQSVWVHIHDSTGEQCDTCESHSYDELGPVYHS